jgi:hypothetical protein
MGSMGDRNIKIEQLPAMAAEASDPAPARFGKWPWLVLAVAVILSLLLTIKPASRLIMRHVVTLLPLVDHCGPVDGVQSWVLGGFPAMDRFMCGTECTGEDVAYARDWCAWVIGGQAGKVPVKPGS